MVYLKMDLGLGCHWIRRARKRSLRASRTISLLPLYSPASIMRSMTSKYSLLSLMVRLSCIFPGIGFTLSMVSPARIMSMQHDSKT